MRVAWIGLGQIGKQMALRVLAAGHEVIGHSRNPDRHRDVEAAGATLTTSATFAVRAAQVVCVNVFDEYQLNDAMIEQGALAAMKAGAILIVHSTVGPQAVADLAAQRADVATLDASFSGTAEDAASGRIALMVGGSKDALENVRPVVDAYADYVSHLGPLGSGMLLKLVNNSLFGAQMLLAGEALRIAASGGIDRQQAAEVIARSSGGSFAMRMFLGSGDTAERLAGIKRYITKDVMVARQAAEQSGIVLGLLDEATRPFLDA